MYLVAVIGLEFSVCIVCLSRFAYVCLVTCVAAYVGDLGI